MVVINHVEKIAQPKTTVTAPAPSKGEQVKEKAEAKSGRKAKEE